MVSLGLSWRRYTITEPGLVGRWEPALLEGQLNPTKIDSYHCDFWDTDSIATVEPIAHKRKGAREARGASAPVLVFDIAKLSGGRNDPGPRARAGHF